MTPKRCAMLMLKCETSTACIMNIRGRRRSKYVDFWIVIFGEGTVIRLKTCNANTLFVPSHVLCPLMLTASFSSKYTPRRVTLTG
jgi:hypothetical protein